MTQQYLRTVSVQIEGGKTFTYTGDENGGQGLRITFEITQKDASTPNVARIGIYNLTKSSTAPAFYRGKTVTVSAGYVSGPKYVLFKGQIMQTRNLRVDVTDTVLAILATDGNEPRNYAVVNQTLSQGHTHLDRFQACFAAMKQIDPKLVLGFVSEAALTKTKFPRGAAMFGNIKQHMRELCMATGTSWSIQNGKVQLLDNKKALPGGAIVLNRDTGLVGLAVQTIQGIEGQCLLNGNIVVGCAVKIDERSIQAAEFDPSITGAPNNAQLNQFGLAADGLYKIFVVGHVGDTRGEPFFTSFVGVALSAGSISPALAARGIGTPNNGN
ncbi:baseplate hub protein [Methylobacterium sp. J-067]|uniref:baseplate hub protein n=1 Tax=Methylobacterium sp. J-067 TaxID=2836648 RepID=UPI001FBA74E3|nr:hypothetical protein [Methylobacterium sp. J-067]MCJ2025107.1 hypothetical protein [Methylobacterium sp. J-067]